MEKNVSQDFQDYWNEVKILEQHPNPHLEHVIVEDNNVKTITFDGEDETVWLQEAGLDELAAPFLDGREIAEKELEKAVVLYSKPQREAIKKRVKSLNNTLKQRKNKARHRKTDVREVFKDVENHSTGSQSRSATPDSLDSIDISLVEAVEAEEAGNNWNNRQSPPQFLSVFQPGKPGVKKPLARAPSAPSHYFKDNNYKNIQQELFSNYVPDVAGSESLPLVSFQYTGTLPRIRSGSDPQLLNIETLNTADEEVSLQHGVDIANNKRLSRSHGNLVDPDEYKSYYFEVTEDRTRIDSLDQADVDQLKQILIPEVTAVLDECKKTFRRAKPPKLRKHEGNVFGIPLNVLVEKDEPFRTSDDIPNVPLVIQKLITHLELHCMNEEGILRIPGLKARTDTLVRIIESNYYTNSGLVHLSECLFKVTPHDVAAALKKILRELPQPLLTWELIRMFYLTNELDQPHRLRVLNLLVLLLPRDNRNTLKYILQFFNRVSDYCHTNNMNIHSVATIVAPSLFPQGFTHVEEMSAVMKFAEESIKITECMLRAGDALWLVPGNLVTQLRLVNQRKYNRKENSKPKLFRRGGKHKEVSTPRISNGNITIEAPQFGLKQYCVHVTDNTTAGDVILQIVKEGTNKAELSSAVTKHRIRPLSELVRPDLSLSCILTAAEPETTLSTHFLYEQGGNIVQREVEHSVLLSSVLKENPAARWRLQCRHRNSPK